MADTKNPNPHRAAVDEFADRVQEADLDAVRRLLLFGSVARGTHSADSDIDVLAVVADSADLLTVEDRLREIGYDIMLDRGTVFSIHAVGESTLKDRSDHPFFRNVLAEAETVHG